MPDELPDQAGTVDLDQPILREDAHRRVYLGDEARHRGLASTRIADEHKVSAHRHIRQPDVAALALSFEQGDQPPDLFLDGLEPNQGVEFGEHLVEWPGLRHAEPGKPPLNLIADNPDRLGHVVGPTPEFGSHRERFTSHIVTIPSDTRRRVGVRAARPIWAPLIPATMTEGKVDTFGQDTPLGRAGQPAELAPAFVFLASQESRYVTGETLAVTGGRLFD